MKKSLKIGKEIQKTTEALLKIELSLAYQQSNSMPIKSKLFSIDTAKQQRAQTRAPFTTSGVGLYLHPSSVYKDLLQEVTQRNEEKTSTLSQEEMAKLTQFYSELKTLLPGID